MNKYIKKCQKYVELISACKWLSSIVAECAYFFKLPLLTSETKIVIILLGSNL